MFCRFRGNWTVVADLVAQGRCVVGWRVPLRAHQSGAARSVGLVGIRTIFNELNRDKQSGLHTAVEGVSLRHRSKPMNLWKSDESVYIVIPNVRVGKGSASPRIPIGALHECATNRYVPEYTYVSFCHVFN